MLCCGNVAGGASEQGTINRVHDGLRLTVVRSNGRVRWYGYGSLWMVYLRMNEGLRDAQVCIAMRTLHIAGI